MHNNKVAEKVDKSLRALKNKIEKKNDEISKIIESSRNLKKQTNKFHIIDFSIFDKQFVEQIKFPLHKSPCSAHGTSIGNISGNFLYKFSNRSTCAC